MTPSQATEKISDTQNSAKTTSKSDRQTNRVEEVFVTGEPKSDTRILFRTNSKSYFDDLIPEQYRPKQDRSNLDCESANPTFTIELRDRGHIAYGIKSTPQAIILDVNVLEKISCIWRIVIPTLAGFPELVILVNRAPAALLPALEQIIRNCGHMRYYSLHDSLYDYLEEEPDDNDTDDEILDNRPPPPIVSRLENDYLKPTIGISRVKQYLDSEKNDTVEGPWLPQERNKAMIRFLAEVIRWTNAPHNPYNPRKFQREEMKENLPLLSDELEWFKEREQKRKKEDRLQEGRVRTLRKRNGRGWEEENAKGERTQLRGKRIRRGVTEV